MSSVEIYIVVEGQTEQTFVRDVLASEMATKGIYCHSVLIGKTGHKGGDLSFDRALLDITKFLKQRSDIYISTMFDYFRINKNWPGIIELKQKIEKGTCFCASEKARFLEDATLAEITKLFPDCNPENRVIPYIEMHEFESLLFSDAGILAKQLNINIDKINELLAEYNGPEEINDDPVKAPSKRLETLKRGYRKVAMGKIISERIGIAAIRKKCPHFNDWLERLENLRSIN